MWNSTFELGLIIADIAMSPILSSLLHSRYLFRRGGALRDNTKNDCVVIFALCE